MGEFRTCPTCGKYDGFGYGFMDHRCKPMWECRQETKWMADDDWQTIHASDSEEAAEVFAERYDCEGGEYVIVGGKCRDDFVVQVRKPGETEIERYSIEAEAVPQYRGTKLKCHETTI